MRSKSILLLLMFVAPSLVSAQGIICGAPGGQIACVIPGATVTGSGASQALALPGLIGISDGSVSAPAYTFGSQNSMGFWKIGTNQLGFLGSGLTIHSTTNTGAGGIRGLQLTSDPGSPRSDVAASDGSGAYDRLVVSGNPIQFATFETAFSVNSSGRVASATDYFDAVGGKSGTDPAMYAFGSSTNINLRFRPKGSGYLAVGSADNTGNIGALTDRMTGLYAIGLHSGATAMTFSTSSGDAVALTLGTDKSATLTGTITAASLLTSTGLSTTYLCVDTAGKFINDAAACIISAAKFKENVTVLDSKDALALVLGMRPVNYDLKDHAFDGWKNQFGFIADEAAKLRPELATYDEEGNVHGFRYEQYTAYLTGAIQQLNARIESLEKR